MDHQGLAGIGIILVGNEILTGKRQDAHLPAMIKILSERGLELDWVRMVGDDEQRLTRVLQQSFATDDLVFSFGGIGPTPDDMTRQCAARAVGHGMEVNAAGKQALLARYGEAETTPERITMVTWPTQAQVIPNPINQVPGFSLFHHHFVPGFPNMAWPMVEWVLDTHYADLQPSEPTVEYLFEALNTPESKIIADMQAVTNAYPQVGVACLPNTQGRNCLEFGLRGKAADAKAAYQNLFNRLETLGCKLNATCPPPEV